MKPLKFVYDSHTYIGRAHDVVVAIRSGEKVLPNRKKLTISNLGFAVHHDYRVGRLVIVDKKLHDQVSHKGGAKLWAKD